MERNNEDITGRAERLKAAFPGAYTDKSDGLVTFDMDKVAGQLGLFSDWVLDTAGRREHPLEGGPHFRIGTLANRPEVWVVVPVKVANNLSSWSWRIQDWGALASAIEAGLQAAAEHVARKKETQA